MSRRRWLQGMPAFDLTTPGDRVDLRIVEFHRHWEKFLRAYLGCPSWATNIKECDLNRGLWEYPEFVKAAKAGRELFDLEKK